MPCLSSTCGGLGALWANCYGAFHPIGGGVLWAPCWGPFGPHTRYQNKKSKKTAFLWQFWVFLGGFGGPDPKVMGTIETSLSIWLIWHLRKSNQTDGYGDIRVKIKKMSNG